MVALGTDTLLSSVVRVKGQAYPTSSLEVNELLGHLEHASWHPWEQQLWHLGEVIRRAGSGSYPRPTESDSKVSR